VGELCFVNLHATRTFREMELLEYGRVGSVPCMKHQEIQNNVMVNSSKKKKKNTMGGKRQRAGSFLFCETRSCKVRVRRLASEKTRHFLSPGIHRFKCSCCVKVNLSVPVSFGTF
jgi:hypothetical protein